MNDPQGGEGKVRAWLRDGPDEAPDDLVEAVLAEFTSVRQRPAWLVLATEAAGRTAIPPAAMGTVALVAVAALLVISSVLVGPGRPSMSPPTGAPAAANQNTTQPPGPSRPVPTAASTSGEATTFASPMFGYSMTVGPAWLGHPGAGGWVSGIPTPMRDLGLDSFVDVEASGRFFILGSRTIAQGTTLAGWTAAIVKGSRGLGPYTWGPPEPINLGGEPANLVPVTCATCGEAYFLVLAVHANEGFYLDWVSDPSRVAQDRDALLTLMSTFEYCPCSPRASPAASR